MQWLYVVKGVVGQLQKCEICLEASARMCGKEFLSLLHRVHCFQSPGLSGDLDESAGDQGRDEYRADAGGAPLGERRLRQRVQGAGGEAEGAGGHARAADHPGARDSPRGVQSA